MKILVADKLSEKAVASLKDLGAEVTVNPDLGSDDLSGFLEDSEILIVRSTRVTAAAMEAAQNLSVIIRAGAGVNTIDLEYASNHGIYVTNCPGKNTDAVAELVIGLLLAADRRIVSAGRDLQQGKWRKKEYGKARGLKARVFGIIGLGSIGKAVAKRAQGLEMQVVAWSRSLTKETAEQLGIEYCPTPRELARQADAVSVHLAYHDETRYFVNEDFLNQMKDGAIFINASRGEIVDTQALKSAMEKKNLRVALDVFENEPAGGESDFGDRELAAMATCTPHIGASTDQAAEAIADEVVRIVQAYRDTGKPANTVNIREKTCAITNLVVRHYNRVGVLAGVLDELRNEGVNIEEMENTIFNGSDAASCTLRLDDIPSKALVEKIGQDKNIIQAFLK